MTALVLCARPFLVQFLVSGTILKASRMYARRLIAHIV